MPAMTRLTLDQVSRDNPKDSGTVTALELSQRGLSDVSCLGVFQSLEKLDLRLNCLSTLEGLSSCSNLKWLSVVENKLVSLKGIEGLSKLTVLNAGKNKLKSMDGITYATSLQALILNDNNISSICKLDQLKFLNTLVLSRNPIHEIGDALKEVKSIRKLSLSHCQIEEIGSSLKACPDLKEARFSHNQITTLPAELARNAKLHILDLGNNAIEKLSDLKVLSTLRNLKNLNLQGNPVVEKDKLSKKVKKFVPDLRTFNGKLIEWSNMGEKISRETSIHNKNDPSIANVFDAEVEREVKRNKPNKDLKVSGVNTVKISNKEVHTLLSSTAVEVEKEMKRKKTHKDIDAPTDQTTSGKSKEKKSKRKPESRESKFEGIDDVETPFMDLILLKEDHEVAPVASFFGGLAVDRSRKKKKSKSGITGQEALELLPPVSEVGMGGASTWDD